MVLLPTSSTTALLLLWAIVAVSTTTIVGAFAPQPPRRCPSTCTATTTRLHSIQSIIQNWGKTVKASHILIVEPTNMVGNNMSGSSGDLKRSMAKADAIAKLEELKVEIDNDAEKFAAAAQEYSCCPSSQKGGSLGEFGPGKMVGNFDTVCFKEEVGKVHGPIWTPFGHHIIYIEERTGEK